MGDAMHYTKAPITEAIIDLRASLPPEVCVRELGAVIQGNEAAYPTRRDRSRAVGQFCVGGDVSASATSEHIGFAFTSDDGKRVLQARLDGFTFSRLAPYDRWASFRDEAKCLWQAYRAAVRPVTVDRVAVRYINRFDFPIPVTDFCDYLRTVPTVSPDLPQGVAGFFVRLSIPQEDLRGVLLLNEAIVEPADPGVVSIVLDIDVYREEAVSSDDEQIWQFLELLHERKNDVFEACITDRTRELIR